MLALCTVILRLLYEQHPYKHRSESQQSNSDAIRLINKSLPRAESCTSSARRTGPAVRNVYRNRINANGFVVSDIVVDGLFFFFFWTASVETNRICVSKCVWNFIQLGGREFPTRSEWHILFPTRRIMSTHDC